MLFFGISKWYYSLSGQYRLLINNRNILVCPAHPRLSILGKERTREN